MTGLMVSNEQPQEMENVTPEEQAAYEKYVSKGMDIIFNQKAMPALLDKVKKAKNPVEGLSEAMVLVVMRLDDAAAKAGQNIDGDVKLHGATELMENLTDMVEAAGIHKFTPEESEQAYYLALDRYGAARQQKGDLPQEAIKQDFDMLMQADQQGRLEEVLPGANEAAQKFGGVA